MATLEDKILGEKLQNYCSSSEDEGSGDEETRNGDEETLKICQALSEPTPINNWNGSATNTGPKGVLEDWRKFRELEAQYRDELTKERMELARKHTLQVRTAREEDEANRIEAIEDELIELLDEGFLMQYQKQRMQELMMELHKPPKFGKLATLKTQEEFLSAIDNEDFKVTVIVHIYSNGVKACESMNGCLNILVKEYPGVKFCKIAADVTGLSRHFRIDGVPALLVYKAGQIIGNFVKLANELGEDFFATDVEKFLIEFGMLPEK